MGRESVGLPVAVGLKKQDSRGKIYLVYSMLFVVVCVVVYRFFWQNGRSLIWGGDGWNQHYKALVYYAKWLRSIVKGIFLNHELKIPVFSFSFGYGADIYTTLHYYAIGDPLNLFSVFVPTDFMMYFYEFLILLRLYLAGVVFMKFCFYVHGNQQVADVSGKSGDAAGLCGTAVLTGAFTYVFCGYTMFAAVRHPFFVNPMIYLPLVLLGVEKLLREKKTYCFILSVFLSAVSNFYFFYVIVLLTVIYVIFRLVMLRCASKDCHGIQAWQKPLLCLLQIAANAVVGVLLSAVVLLPVILLFLGDARSESVNTLDLFYSRAYYEKFLSALISGAGLGKWSIMAYSAVVLPALILLFLQKKRNTALKIGVLLLTSFLLFPVFGHVFNGFSYVSNRWLWGYGFLLSYILAVMWERLFAMTRRECCLLAIVYGGYALAGMLLLLHSKPQNKDYFAFQLVMAAAAILIFSAVSMRKTFIVSTEPKKYFRMLPGILVLCVALCSIMRNAESYFEDYASKFVRQANINRRLASGEHQALVQLKDDSFWRYTGSAVTKNASILSGLSNTQYAWSLANGVIAEFFKSVDMPEPIPYVFRGLDDRTMLNTMLGVKYYVSETEKQENAFVPFGYKEVELNEKKTAKKYNVYENAFTLPLGYTYSGYMLQEDYDKLPVAARQEAMLQALVLEEPEQGFAEVTPHITLEEVPFEIGFGNKHVSKQGNSFVVTKKGASVTLKFAEQTKCETYLLLAGLHYQGVPSYQLYNDDKSIDPYDLFTQETWNALSEKEQKAKKHAFYYYEEPVEIDMKLKLGMEDGGSTEKVLSYCTPKYVWYNNVHDFMVNMGYHEQGAVSVKIKFPYVGIYRFEELGVFCQPMEQYTALVSERKEDVLQELDLHNDNAVFATDLVTGTITLEEPKLLFLGIPISKGWTAYVDGKETKLQKANIIGMALPLTAGRHTIRLEYRTPGLIAGVLCSMAGCCCLVGIWLYRRRKFWG